MTPKLLNSSTFSLHYANLLIEFAACFISINYISTINIVLTLVYLILIPPVLRILSGSKYFSYACRSALVRSRLQYTLVYPTLRAQVLPLLQL